MKLRVGFVGLGNIGRPMAARLVAAGMHTTVYDVDASAVAALVDLGAHAATAAQELAVAADVTGVCVRDDEQLRAVVTGGDGLLAGASEGDMIAVHSTVLPDTVRELAAVADKQGVVLMDACITGGASGAEQGTLTTMVASDEATLEGLRPYLDAFSASVLATGPVGSAAATKLCNNLVTYLEFLAAFESRLLAAGSGLDPDTLERVLVSNGNLTDQMQSFLALHKLPAAAREDPGLQTMLAGFAGLAEKDLALTLEYAAQNGVDLPGTERCRELMRRVYGVIDND